MTAEVSTGGRRYGGMDPDDRRELRRGRLFDAALAAVVDDDPSALTLTALCRASGVAARYFYEEFGSVEALLVALHDRLVDDLIVEMREVLRTTAGTPEQRARQLIATYVAWVAADERRARVFVAVIGAGTQAEAARRHALARFAALVREISDELLGPGVVPPSWAYAELFLVAGVQVAIEEWIADPGRCPPEELVAQIEFVFLAVMGSLTQLG